LPKRTGSGVERAVGVVLLLLGLLFLVGGILTSFNVWGLFLDLDSAYLVQVGLVSALFGLFLAAVGWALVRRS
jgi:hypothetical protein